MNRNKYFYIAFCLTLCSFLVSASDSDSSASDDNGTTYMQLLTIKRAVMHTNPSEVAYCPTKNERSAGIKKVEIRKDHTVVLFYHDKKEFYYPNGKSATSRGN